MNNTRQRGSNDPCERFEISLILQTLLQPVAGGGRRDRQNNRKLNARTGSANPTNSHHATMIDRHSMTTRRFNQSTERLRTRLPQLLARLAQIIHSAEKAHQTAMNVVLTVLLVFSHLHTSFVPKC